MGKSIREYIASLGHWGWVVGGLIVADAIGIAQSFFAEWILPTLGWWLILVAILLTAPFLAFHRLRVKRDEMQGELDSLKNPRAVIRVKPQAPGALAFLEIHNEGVDADFTAEAAVVRGVPLKTRHTMCWDSSPHLNHPIKSGGTSKVMVAEIGVADGALVLCKLGMSGAEQVVATTLEMINAIRQNMRYPTMAAQIDDSCVLEITITGTPPLREPFVDRRYVVKIDHEQGHKLVLASSESTSDKGD